MPGKFANGTYNPGEYGDYYCDANNVGGVWCPEFDLSEANVHTIQTTSHKCSETGGPDWESCDKAGCMTNIGWRHNKFGQRDADIIDTHEKYTHEVSFIPNSDGTLATIQNVLSQGD